MNFRVACLLLGVQLAFAEVYNYGAGGGGGGSPNPGIPPVTGGGGGIPQQPTAWQPWNDLGNVFNPTNPVGGSWTYQPSSWQPWSPPTPQPWTPTPPVAWTTQWASWVPVTNQAPNPTSGAVSQFTQFNGNCQGNYLGAVTQLTLDACAAACLGNPACAGFSFNLRSSYPQCILKNAICGTPDTGATFTFFARKGYQPTVTSYYPDYPTFVPAGPPVVVGVGNPYARPPPPPLVYPGYGFGPYLRSSPFWKSASVRQFKRPGSQYFELPANCSGPILQGPYPNMLENCADDCSSSKRCTGFSYDNMTSSCVLHTGVCQSMHKSTQWTYFVRGDRRSSMNKEQPMQQQQQQQHLPQQRPALLPSRRQQSQYANEIKKSLNELDMGEAASQYVQQKPPMNRFPHRGLPSRPASRPYGAPPKNYAGFPYNYNPMNLMNRFEQKTGNCPGNAIGETVTKSLDECARLCLQNNECAGFSFNIRVQRPEDFQCMIKSQSCSEVSENSPYRFFMKRKLTSSMGGLRFRQPGN